MADASRPIRACFYVFFPAGGIGRYTNELSGALNARAEVSVDVVCAPDFQWKDAPEYEAQAVLKSISHSVPLLRRLRFLQGQFTNPKRCIRYAVEHGADIIHFANVNHLSFPFWRKPLEQSGIRVALSAHDVKRQKSIINRAWEDRQLKAFYRFADALFVHAAYQADELVEYAGVRRDKIHIVPHGLYAYPLARISQQEARAELGIPTDRRVALFFGQIRDEKNLDQLIHGLQMSTAKPHLVVAGNAGGRHRGIDFYQDYARRHGVDHLITFIPKYIPDEKVGELFVASDWVALPYSNVFSSQSGVLNVAAFFERPVLVSSSPVLRETVATCDIGVVCDGDTAAAIADGIDRMDRRIRDGHQHQFQVYQERYSWQENARLTVDVYKALLR